MDALDVGNVWLAIVEGIEWSVQSVYNIFTAADFAMALWHRRCSNGRQQQNVAINVAARVYRMIILQQPVWCSRGWTNVTFCWRDSEPL